MTEPVDLRLLRLEIEGYGRLRDWTFEPTREPGALVVAPNEAGKTTVASALFRGLFGFSDKAREDARRPWEGGPFALTLEWAVGDTTTCRFRRDFDTQTVEVEWRVDGALDDRWEGEPNPRGRSSDLEIWDRHLRRLLGFTSPDIFRQTAFVRPGDPDARPLAGELLRLLSGSERADFRAALAAFEEGWYERTRMDVRDPRRAAKHKPRALERLAEERDELVRRRAEARAAREARRGAEEALESARARVAELDREIAERDDTRRAIDQLRWIADEIAEVEERVGELDRAAERFRAWEEEVREKTKALEPLVRYLRVPDDYPGRLGRIEALARERAEALARAGEAERQEAALGGRTGQVALAAGAVLAVAAGLLFALRPGLAAVAGGAGALAAVLLGWGGWRLAATRRERRAAGLRVAARRDEAGDLARRAAAAAAEIGLDPDSVDVEAERERFERARRLRIELDAMQRARETFGDREAIERERRRLKEEELDVRRLERRKILEKRPYLAAGPEYERRFQAEVERLEKEREAAGDEELRCRRAVADLPSAREDPHRLATGIERLEEAIARRELERDAYGLAHRTLEACKGEFLEVMTRRLAGRVAGVFEELTDGRYRGVEIDPETLDLAVHGAEKRSIPGESLSRGTRDQLYFAIRVAVLEELARDRALPLLLDDPFLHFDRARLARVERTLERLGRRHQVLLFTHDARVALWTFPRRSLPALTASPVPAPSGD